MKIIGKTVSGFILEATDREVLQIVGSDSTYLSDEKAREMSIRTGFEIKLDPLYEAIVFEKGRARRLENLGKEIRDAASIVEKAAAAIKAPRGSMPEKEA